MLMQEYKADELKKNLMVIASDEMQGRDSGSEGQKAAGKYMINFYKNLGVLYLKRWKDYYQIVPKEALKTKKRRFAKNLRRLSFHSRYRKSRREITYRLSAHSPPHAANEGGCSLQPEQTTMAAELWL